MSNDFNLTGIRLYSVKAILKHFSAVNRKVSRAIDISGDCLLAVWLNYISSADGAGAALCPKTRFSPNHIFAFLDL
jgi:hypothetical protein